MDNWLLSSSAALGGEATELDTFILFRSLALLAWTGNHASDATEATALAPAFAQGISGLAESNCGDLADIEMHPIT